MEDDLKHTHVLAKGVALFVIFFFTSPKKNLYFPYSLAHVRVVGELCSILSNIFSGGGGEGRFTFSFWSTNIDDVFTSFCVNVG